LPRINWRAGFFGNEIVTKKAISAPQKRKWVRLTRACNNRCLFCLDADALDGRHESLDGITSALREGREEGCRRVVLSGGEPAIHPEFIRIIGLARQLGYTHVQVITNGRMFSYSEFLRQAVKAGLSEVTFSVHGASAAQHDRLAGVPGAFSQTLLGISNAVKIRGLIVSSDIVVNGVNVDSLFEIVSLLHRLKINEYDLLHLIPFGRAWKNWKILSYNPLDKKNIFRRVFRFAEAAGAHLWTNRFPLPLLEGEERYMQHPDKILDEVRGARSVFNKFIRSGKKMFCSGRRCRFCVLEQFCLDLEKLRAAGFLRAAPVPRCLPGKPFERKRVSGGSDVMEIAAFYIRERMTVKAAACAQCRENIRCRGAHVKTVMQKGFSALVPVGRV